MGWTSEWRLVKISRLSWELKSRKFDSSLWFFSSDVRKKKPRDGEASLQWAARTTSEEPQRSLASLARQTLADQTNCSTPLRSCSPQWKKSPTAAESPRVFSFTDSKYLKCHGQKIKRKVTCENRAGITCEPLASRNSHCVAGLFWLRWCMLLFWKKNKTKVIWKAQ